MAYVPAIPYTRHWTEPDLWLAPGRTPLPSTPRDTLVPGSYIPGPGTAGIIPGTVFTPWEGNVDGDITLTDANAVYENIEFWGQVRPKAPGIVFRNCIFRGKDPDGLTTGLHGCIKNYGLAYYHFKMYDCLIDQSGWVTERGSNDLSPSSAGIHGGDFEAYRIEITGVQDGINYVAHGGWDANTTANDRFAILEASWIHKMYYKNNWFGPSDGRTHSDAFQFNTGKNITIRHNMIGGERDSSGYMLWPGGYNAGDDAANAAFMIKQELNATAEAKIENVLIEHNWIRGGAAGINHFFMSSRPNDFSTMKIKDNIFFQRGPLENSAATGPGTYTEGPGYYAIVSWGIDIATVYENNTILETGEPIVIRRNDGG